MCSRGNQPLDLLLNVNRLNPGSSDFLKRSRKAEPWTRMSFSTSGLLDLIVALVAIVSPVPAMDGYRSRMRASTQGLLTPKC
ncbi:hypothetical protein BJX99DRAFT_219881 [Aspergillus californicus]